jgi:hypothetical protein
MALENKRASDMVSRIHGDGWLQNWTEKRKAKRDARRNKGTDESTAVVTPEGPQTAPTANQEEISRILSEAAAKRWAESQGSQKEIVSDKPVVDAVVENSPTDKDHLTQVLGSRDKTEKTQQSEETRPLKERD